MCDPKRERETLIDRLRMTWSIYDRQPGIPKAWSEANPPETTWNELHDISKLCREAADALEASLRAAPAPEGDDPRLETLVMRLPSTSRARHDYDLLASGHPQVMVRLDESQMAEIRNLSASPWPPNGQVWRREP